MASRKSSRIKKSPVVYQAPDPALKAAKNVPIPKQIPPPRRLFSRDIELQMECMDDELSPAQLKAIKEAQKEHDKANDLIKEVRAGNILVPSSQPNTFTIVPPKPPPAQPPPAPVQVQAPSMKSPSPPEESSTQRGLPPPRPAQFLSKQLQEMNKSAQVVRSPGDVILISDPAAGGPKLPVSQVTANPVQLQQMTTILSSQGGSATPQQVYKFVSVPSNMPTNVVQNQWALRPLLTVPPQQQQQQMFLTTAARGVAQFAPVRTVPMQSGQVQMPAPRFTNISGEELEKVGGAKSAGEELYRGEAKSAREEFDRGGATKLTDRMSVRQCSSVIQKQYLTHNGINRNQTKVGGCFQGAEYQHGIRTAVRNSERTHCISSPVYSWKVRLHCVKISVLFSTGKARQAYNKYQVEVAVSFSLYKHSLKSVRLKNKAAKCLRLESTGTDGRDNCVLNWNEGGANIKNNQSCDKDKCAYGNVSDSQRNTDEENKLLLEKVNAHIVCDNLDSAYTGDQNSDSGNKLDTDISQVLREKTSLCKESYSTFESKKQEIFEVTKQLKCCIRDVALLQAQKREHLDTVMCNQGDLLGETLFGNCRSAEIAYLESEKCTFKSASVRLKVDSGENEIDGDKKYIIVNRKYKVNDHSDVAKKQSGEFSDCICDNYAYQHEFQDYLAAHHSSQRSYSATRQVLKELDNRNRGVNQLDHLKKFDVNSVSCFKRNKVNVLKQQNIKGHRNKTKRTIWDNRNKAKRACWDKENITVSVKPPSVVQSKAFWWNKKEIPKSSLYETVTMKKVHRTFGIVNMIYESTNCVYSKNIGSNPNTPSVDVDENSAAGGSQIATVTQLACEIAKETESNEINDASVDTNPDLNERCQTNVVEPKLQGSLNLTVDLDVSEGSKQMNDTVDGDCNSFEQSSTMILEDKKKAKDIIVKTNILQERNGNFQSFEDLNEISESDVAEKNTSSEEITKVKSKSNLNDKFADIMGKADKVRNNNLDTDDMWSECEDICSGEEEMEHGHKEQESSLDTPKMVKKKWYDRMSEKDALCVAVLCRQFGFAKMSRDLQIPKTVLLKLRRHVRKSKYGHSMAVCTAAKSQEVLNPPKTSEDTSHTSEQVDVIERNEISLLQKYHPGLYIKAQTLLTQGSTKHTVEECSDISVDGEAKDIHCEELEPCQRTMFVSIHKNVTADKSQSSQAVDKPLMCLQEHKVNRQGVKADIKTVENMDCYNTENNSESASKVLMSDRSVNYARIVNEDENNMTSRIMSFTKAGRMEPSETLTINEVRNEQNNEIQNRSQQKQKLNSNTRGEYMPSSKQGKDMCWLKNNSEADSDSSLGDLIIDCSDSECYPDIIHFDDRDCNPNDNEMQKKSKDFVQEGKLNSSATLNQIYDENSVETHDLKVNVSKIHNLLSQEDERQDQNIENSDRVEHNDDSYRHQGRDECKSFFYSFSHDHCYLTTKLTDTEKKIKEKCETRAEKFLEDENETFLEHETVLDQPFAKCLANSEDKWEEIEGRKVKVYSPLPERRLKEIVKYASVFGLELASSHYNITKAHVQGLCSRDLSCLGKEDNSHTFASGIPAKYISSDFVGESSFSFCSQEVPNEDAIEDYSHVSAESVTQGSSVHLKTNIDSRPDPVIIIVISEAEQTTNNGEPRTDNSYMALNESTGSVELGRNASAFHDQVNEVCLQEANCEKIETTANTSGNSNSDHPVYTKEFLAYAVRNKLFTSQDRVSTHQEKMAEIVKELEYVDEYKNVKTFTNKNGKVLHRYSPKFQRRMLVLASKVGLKPVSEAFDIKFETLKNWKDRLKKALKINCNQDTREKDEEHPDDKIKGTVDLEKKVLGKNIDDFQVLRRVILSRELKIKLVHLCKTVGFAEVCTKYNLNKKSLRRWMTDYENEALPDYEFSSEELVELVDYEIYREEVLKKKSANSKIFESICDLRETSALYVSCQQESTKRELSGFQVNTEEDKEQNVRERQKNIGDEVSKLTGSIKNSDRSRRMTYPNNMEVILDIDDESDGDSQMQDLDCNSHESLNGNPALKGESYLGKDDNSDNTLINSKISKCSADTTETADPKICEEESTKKQFLDQNSYFMEAVNNELALNESENEDVSEIISWDVDHEMSGGSSVLTEKPVKEKASNSDTSEVKSERVDVLKQNIEEDDEQCYDQDEKIDNNSLNGKRICYEKDMHKPDGDQKLFLTCDSNEIGKAEVGKSIKKLSDNSTEVTDDVVKEKSLIQMQQNSCAKIEAQAGINTSEGIGYMETACDGNDLLQEKEQDSKSDPFGGTQADNLFVDVKSSEVIYVSDSEDSCPSNLQLLSPSAIKEEPYDDEFDRIEKGRNFKKFTNEQITDDGNCKKRSNSGLDRKENPLSGLENNISVADNSGKKGSKSFEINQLGIGDGNSSQSQGNTFQSSSGNNHSRSEGTAPGSMTSNSGSSDLNISSLPVSGTNIQIVGTQDLIPGQEYILVDPRLFNSGSNTFQTLRPPTLLRPQIRQPVNTTNIVRARPPVSTVSIMPSGVPTPVHVVENRSVRMSTSSGPTQITPPAPRLTLYGSAGASREVQDRRVIPKSPGVSLLSGISTASNRLQGKIVVTSNPSINLPDRKNTSPGRSVVMVSANTSTVMPQISSGNASSVVKITTVTPNLSTDAQQTKRKSISPAGGSVNISQKSSLDLQQASRRNASPTGCLQIVSDDNTSTSAEIAAVSSDGIIQTTGNGKTDSASSEKDRKLSYTLKGVGSISNENLSLPGTSEDKNPVMLREDYDNMHGKTVLESDNQSKQFSKSLPHSGLLLVKERKLLQALLLQKSGKKTSRVASPYSTSTPLDTSKVPQHSQNSNRIDSLIQKMTNRFQNSTDNLNIQSSLSVIDRRKSKNSDVENDGKPASASEILFGEHSSPKKKEVNSLEDHSVDSLTKLASTVSETETCSESKTSSTLVKKDLRKSVLVTREIDFVEDESSSSSSTSASSSSSSTASSDQRNEPKDGRIEQVDLSAKLQSLLTADIFNVIEPQKRNVEEEDDLIEILSKPSDKYQRESDIGTNITTSRNINDETETSHKKKNLPMKKGGINYSINIKKKLGKLASMFSTVSLSKKYGINANTLSKWKAKYQDEEIAGLQLTEAELKELDEVNQMKKALYGTAAPEYDIYVDNPEEDEHEVATGSSEPKQKDELKVGTGSVGPFEQDRIEIEHSKSNSSDKVTLKPESNQSTLSKHRGTSKDSQKFGTPLYICVENDATEEVKQQLRRKMKTQRTAEESWSNGAFLKTTKISLASVFGHDSSKSEDEEQKKSLSSAVVTAAEKSSKSRVSSDTDSASEKESDRDTGLVNVQREKLKEKTSEVTVADSDNMTWEKTVYLCPDEGIFKYRYEMKKAGQVSSNVAESNENQTMSVLDTLFKTPSEVPVSTASSPVAESQSTSEKSKDQQNTSSSPSDIARMLKETPRRASIIQSTKPLQTIGEKSFNKENKQLSVLTKSYSEDFKWKVVKEARLSGFEHTAKMYSISMTDIMKWHDSLLDERKTKDIDTMQTNTGSATEITSSVVDLTADEDERHFVGERSVAGIPGKEKPAKFNANLSFERIQVKEGTITKPRFKSKPPVISPAPSSAFSAGSRPQRTRMGPNSIKYARPKVDPEQLEKFHADVEGDLGIMPKIMKKPRNRQEGLEIASTWKQVQSVLNPSKSSEKKYSQEFKNKIIKDCEQKGQKSVALEHQIPYNEISRWRLEAKKASLTVPSPNVTSVGELTKLASLPPAAEAPYKTHIKKSLSDSSKEQLVVNDTKPQNEQESLKIKIRLSSLSQATPPALNKKKTDFETRSSSEQSISKGGTELASVGKKKLPVTGKIPETSVKNSPQTSKGNQESKKNNNRHASGTERRKSMERTEPVSIDEDVDLRTEVINFCLEHGVLKTQKKFNVTRQSIIDLMKEYDELNKYEVDNYNKSRELHSFKTRLVSREKTSVEVTNTATQPVIVKNLNDYIVTQEYMQTVVDYALKHGITAATRKYKRKTNTVRSWINQFQREVKKKISVEQMAKEQELLAKNMSIEEARQISNLEARKKKQLLEAEFKRHIVEFAREFGITAASRRFKKKAATVKSWMAHFMKGERDAKRLEEAEARKKQAAGQESTKSPRSSSPKRLSVHQESVAQKSPSSYKQKTPPQSPIWEQDFVIKPISSKSPLKLTFSPRRKSSPIIVIGSSTEEDTVDDETNDIETDDEQENISGDYFEVAAWDVNSSGGRSEAVASNLKRDESVIIDLEEGDLCDEEKTNDSVVDLISDTDNSNRENTSYEENDKLPENKNKYTSKDNSVISAIQQPQVVTENVVKTSNLGKQLIGEQMGVKSKADSSQFDVFISPMEVPNIFDTDDMPGDHELIADKERVGENISLEGNSAINSDFQKKLVEGVADLKENEEENTEAPVEDEAMKIPYEETVMFKLLTDEVDTFIKDDASLIKYKGNEAAASKPDEKAVVPNDNRDNKLGPVKKFKKYADAEIMQNIEETYLFTGSRVTRHAVDKELQANIDVADQEQEENEMSGSGVTGETRTVLKDKNNDGLEGNENDEENQMKQDKSNIKDIPDISSVKNDSKEQSKEDTTMPIQSPDFQKNENSCIDLDTTAQESNVDIQKKVERSLFDMLVSPSEKSEVAESDSTNFMPTSVDTDVSMDTDKKEDDTSPSFCLFGSLMKNLKLPEAVGVQSSPVSENNSVSEGIASTSLMKEIISEEKSVDVDKDRNERNLFDFIGLEPESPKSLTNDQPSPAQSPRMKTRSLAKAGSSPIKSPYSPSPVKILSVKKPMFKFPKLASPINFGNIAKLGIAKMKEEEKAKESKECKDEDCKVVSDREVEEKVQGESNRNAEKDTTLNVIKEDENEVVMETFEELRQRLARERAANKLEKEKAKAVVVDAETIDIDEIDGSREACPNIATSQSSEIGDEMYKDFTPQKIVLILDISKKHGIEFASTSFGLPVSVIVNWIIEKDRKQRKVALSVSLEEKLKALKNLKDGLVSKENTKEHHSIDSIMLDKWESESGWLLENKSVCDVLEKWQKVETVTNLNFEECVKNLERKDSVTEKANNEEPIDSKEEAEKLSGVETSDKVSEDSEVVITHVEKQSTEKDNEVLVTESIPEEPSTETRQIDLPDILSFVKTKKPRDFNTEQKAMFVLLVEKYGRHTISKKFGINSGTLHGWRHSSKPVRQFLYEQTGSKTFKDGGNTRDTMTKKVLAENQCKTSSSTDYLLVRERLSDSDQKKTESSYKSLKISEARVSSKTTKHCTAVSTEKKMLDDDLVDHPKGYRIISPTKLPPILRDIKRCQTKDYTLEQKVAIVKLVQLYGVRTIHKQFHIPAGSIWNWQHAKNVVEVLKRDEKVEDNTAHKQLDFDKDDEEEPVTIDTILDRVLIASESVNHLNFKQDQKADVVCLISHFGIDYFCEKVPQIPRGTLWNWRHNRHVATLVEKRNEQLKRFTDMLNERKEEKARDNVVGEAIDKTDLTQKWVKDLQESSGDGRGLSGFRDSSVESMKRKRNVEDEISSITNKTKKPKLGPMCYKRTLPSERSHRSLSPSSVTSEISVHSNDFEEILSDDELNTPSVVSRRSATSTQTVQSNKTDSVQRTSKGSASGRKETGLSSQTGGLENNKKDETTKPVYEVVKCEIGSDDRMMVCYKVLESKDAAASQHVRSTELANKRPAHSDVASGQPPAKKRNPKVSEVVDQSGNWVPLDEYYYGTNEGENSYTEEKGEYRFKCWYCSKMLYNNVRAMQHIQGHIDASKQQNIDLSDLTQCKHCYKQFDTPFEMQTHVEKVHLSNKVLMCRICEKDFATPRELMTHMKGNHHACEMPYQCHLCHFRSSMYSDVVDHFKKKHDSSHFMLCLYCLRTFEVKFVSQGWGQTQTYYGHLLKHQSKSANKKCVVCRLTFFNAADVKNHRRTCHVPSLHDMKALSPGGKSDSGLKQKKGSNLKSLNAPSVSRIQDYGDVTFPPQTAKSKCIECKMMMSSTDHYKKYVHCSMCRFATSCSVAYANHMMGFHSGQMSSLNLNIPWERAMKDVMYCACGFSSKYGNKVANHLVYCAKWTCSSTKQVLTGSTPGKTGDRKKEGSLLGMLGLVQKSTVATKIRSVEKPKPKAKSEVKKLDEIEDVKKDRKEIKVETKPDDADVEKKSEPDFVKNQEEKQESGEKSTQDVMETKASEATFEETSEAVKKTDSEESRLKETDTAEDFVKETDKTKENINAGSVIEKSSTEFSKNIEEETAHDENIKDNVEEKPEKERDILEKEKDSETNENLRNITPDKSEKETVDTEEVNEPDNVQQDAQVVSDTLSELAEDKTTLAEEDEQELAEDENEVMDTDTVSEAVSEDLQTDSIAQTKQLQDRIQPEDEIDKSLTEETVKDVEENMDTDTSLEKTREEDDLKDEEVELLKEKEEDESEMEAEAVETSQESRETGGESSDVKESHLRVSAAENMSKKTEDIEQNEPEQAEPTVESPVKKDNENDIESGKPTNESDLIKGEEEQLEEKERDEITEDQDSAKSTERVEEPDAEEEQTEADEESKAIESSASEAPVDQDENSSESKPSDDHRESSERSLSDHRESYERRADDDRHSSERYSSDHRESGERYSSDHRESGERHSKERQESGDRHHSGSGDRSKHDDDRYRLDNRSHGSNRSDSYHGNRSSYDQNRDRDRSYDRDRERDRDRDRTRDRDRDYNRNRDYRQGESRSGYSYQDNRSQGYGGSQGYRGSQGQYGGYQGNRGDHYQNRNRGGHQQDRNHNRNYQNRGGYNQNYRGGYRGGYY